LFSQVLPAIGQADLSDQPAPEQAVPHGWPGHLVPNFSDWQLGDIVLVATDGAKAGRGIQLAQALSRDAQVREAARFTHAAIYVGGGVLIEATPQQPIARRPVWFYCQRRSLMVRRLPHDSVPLAAIESIAAAAASHIGEAYSLSAAVFSKLIPGTEPDAARLYCSTFVGLVVTEATGVRLTAKKEHRPLHPATLAMHPDLVSVALEWRAVAGLAVGSAQATRP
jgi:cell wall-associated NlpC family hydrolase